MALQPANPSIDQNIINQDAELAAIAKVIKAFQNGTKDIAAMYESQIGEAQKRLNEKAARDKAELEAKIADAQARGIIANNEMGAKMAQKLAEQALRTQYKEKLNDEIKILKEVSAANEAERQKELKRLEQEKQILQLRADGNEEEAKQKEKELAQEKKKDKKEERKQQIKEDTQSYEFGDILKEGFQGFTDALADENHAQKVADENLANTLKGVGKAITEGLNAINNAISEYAKYQAGINSRLQGVSSYSSAIDKLSAVAYSPLLKAEDLYANLADLVGQGIVSNVEQRAMFATVKDSIAGTFDVTSDSLKRLIRIQRNDSTAARLGMEAYLTRFLNVYVENTEYLQSTFDTVSNSLLEASAMMYLSNNKTGAGASAELEFVVQKWLGTLSGVGLSDAAAQSIADAIGQLGSGNVDALGSNDIQNLIVMAASKVGLNYGEMLNSGLDAKQANDLMLGVVEYLQDVAATGTNVVKSQLANVFGVTVSDLVAVSNLGDSALKQVHGDLMSYSNMYGELASQFKELPGRLGISNILENLFANLTYQTGMDIGSNPVTFALWKITDMIQGVTGGINLPFISAFGNGFDLNTTVENLMKIGIVGVSTLGNIGKIASGLGSIGDGATLLKKLGVSEGNAAVKSLGSSSMSPSGERASGSSTSASTYVGNNDGDTYSDSAQNAANDDAQKKLDQKSEEYEDPVVKYLDEELKLADHLETIGSKIDTIASSQATMANLQAIMAGSQMMMAADTAATYAALNLLVELIQASAQPPVPEGTIPGEGIPQLESGFEYFDELIRERAQLSELSGEALAAAIAQMGDISASIGGGNKGGGSSSSGSSRGGSSSAGAGSGAGSGAGNAATATSSNAAAPVGDRSTQESSSSASADAASASADMAATISGQVADASADAISAILIDILTQASKTEASVVGAIAPVGTSIANIDTTLITSITQLAALNGAVVAGVESICNQFTTVLEANAFKTSSAYSEYTNSVSQNIDTTYSTIAGDVSNQVEIIKDMFDAKVTPDENGNMNVELYFTAPDIIVDNEINYTPPKVDISNDVDVESPDVHVDVNIEIPASSTPDVNIDIAAPSIDVTPEITTQVNVEPAQIDIPEITVPDTTIPDIAAPEVTVNPEINNNISNVQIPEGSKFDVAQVDINAAGVIIDGIQLNPEIINTTPDVVVNPEINNILPNVNVEAPDVQVDPNISFNPEIINTVPNVDVNPDIEVSTPDIIPPEVAVDAVLDPEITVNPEIVNTVPNVDINNEIVNTPPDVLVDNTIINEVPVVDVNTEIINKVPEINLINNIINDIPDIYVDVQNVVNVPPAQIINTATFNPNIINTVPDVNVYPEIINNLPEVIVNPEIVTTVTPPVVINQSEIVNSVPNVFVEPEITTPVPDVYVESILPDIQPEIEVMEEVNITVPDVNVAEDITVSAPDVSVDPRVEVINTVPNINVEPNIVNEIPTPEIAVNPEVIFTIPNIVVNTEVLNTVPDVNVTSNVVVPDTSDSDSTKTKANETDYERFVFEHGLVNTIVSASTASSDTSDYLISIDFAEGFKVIVDSVSKIKQLMETSNDEQPYIDVSEISGFTTYTFDN